MIKLIPMSKVDYQKYIEAAIPDYAQEQVKAGAWSPKEALQLSAKAYHSLLPDGLTSPDQHLCNIVDDEQDKPVGILWYGLRKDAIGKVAVLYDFIVLEEYRRRGYGECALLTLEEKARMLGIDKILLHVFGHNKVARRLYKKLGYVERNVTMIKRL